VWGEILRTLPDCLWGRLSVVFIGYLVITGSKAAEAWHRR